MQTHRGYTIIATASAVATGRGAYEPIFTVLEGTSTGIVVHQDTVHADFPDEAQARRAAIGAGIVWIDRHAETSGHASAPAATRSET